MYYTICREYLKFLEKKIQSQEIISLPKFPKIAKGTTNIKIDTLNVLDYFNMRFRVSKKVDPLS